jgi:hypothetical protein
MFFKAVEHRTRPAMLISCDAQAAAVKANSRGAISSGHSKLDSTVRDLGIEAESAMEHSEKKEI